MALGRKIALPFGLFRRATAEIEIRGVKIPAGAIVMLRFGTGNRDRERFECPAQLRLERPGVLR